MIAPYAKYCANRIFSRDALEKELASNKKLKEMCDVNFLLFFSLFLISYMICNPILIK